LLEKVLRLGIAEKIEMAGDAETACGCRFKHRPTANRWP
jgi:hypothetical protein